MLSYIIDIFCKDTIVGLSQFEDVKKSRIYKNKYSSLFKTRKEYKHKGYKSFTGQFAYHL